MKVGFIGLGAMGKPMAKQLLKAGLTLTVTDVMEAPIKELAALGAEAKNNAAEVAAVSDIVCSSLPNSAILRQVSLGPGGVLEVLKTGAMHIDLSSVEPALVWEMAGHYQNKGCHFLDAPVSGGVAGAEAATLTIMAGGTEEEFLRAQEVLKFIGRKIFHTGAVGSGQALKLVNNLLLGASMAATAEALALGCKLGLDPQLMYDIISQSSGRCYALEMKGKNFIIPRQFAPGFAVDLQFKDLELAVSTAKNLTVPLPMGNMAQQLFEMARARGLGQEDISAVVKIYEEFTQVEVKSSKENQTV